MADIHHKRVAQRLKEACEETARQAIAATTETGQASRIHHKNRKFGSRKEAMDAKTNATAHKFLICTDAVKAWSTSRVLVF
ncbi:hypothetical protein P43SY_003896 [Pythium insidiosum]|uniref:Uncharacterized protein n=1 Tax=Pythium insidiosum TaxID=114742 RepID=A0AAD5M5L1_PYTIN|nr:hypothetical protein P43SY_003896 [Pythium insidiosum]